MLRFKLDKLRSLTAITMLVVLLILTAALAANAGTLDGLYDEISSKYPQDIAKLKANGASEQDIKEFIAAMETELNAREGQISENFSDTIVDCFMTIFLSGEHENVINAVINGWGLSFDELLGAYTSGGSERLLGLLPQSVSEIGDIVRNKLIEETGNNQAGGGNNNSGSSTNDSSSSDVTVEAGDRVSKQVKPDRQTTVAADGNKLQLTVPAGALNSLATATIKSVPKDEQVAGQPGMIKVGDYQFKLEVNDYSGNLVTAFAKNLVLDFKYSDTDIPAGVQEKDLKVCYWDDNATDPSTGQRGAWIVVPTTVDPVNNKITAKTNHLTIYALLAVADFPELKDTAGHWAEYDILKLISLKIASGDPSGAFRPGDNITRQELAKLVVLAAGLNPEQKPELTFVDSAEISEWAKGYVAAAVKAGIINGYSDNTFNPKRNVTRAEIAAMVVRALGTATTGQAVGFSDSGNIPAWALPYVAGAVQKQIINGYPDNTFRAGEKTTRAQTAKMISNMINIKSAN